MITVRIDNLDAIKAAFSGIRDDQIPFTTALALSAPRRMRRTSCNRPRCQRTSCCAGRSG